MLHVESDPKTDAIYIQLSDELIDYTEELDDNRLIDRNTLGQPVGIDLSSVSLGVKLEGLPEKEAIEKMLVGLGVKVYKTVLEVQPRTVVSKVTEYFLLRNFGLDGITATRYTNLVDVEAGVKDRLRDQREWDEKYPNHPSDKGLVVIRGEIIISDAPESILE